MNEASEPILVSIVALLVTAGIVVIIRKRRREPRRYGALSPAFHDRSAIIAGSTVGSILIVANLVDGEPIVFGLPAALLVGAGVAAFIGAVKRRRRVGQR